MEKKTERVLTEEHKEKIRQANTGRKKSQAEKIKISRSLIKYWNPEPKKVVTWRAVSP